MGTLAFVIYFSLLVLVPATHCYASVELSGNTDCRVDSCPKHLPFLAVEQCCELHESDHKKSDEHHIHFLVDDQSFTAPRYHPTDSSLSPQIIGTVGVVSLDHSTDEGIVVVPFNVDFYQEAVLSCSSGLSPPIS